MRIVVVEDHQDSAEWLTVYLERRGHDVLVLAEGRHLLSTCVQDAPQLVLLDLCLPDADGLELIAPLRRLAHGTTVVVITGETSIPRAVEAMQAGAANFLEKPVNLDALSRVLSQVEERSGIERARTLGGSANRTVTAVGNLLTCSDRMRQMLDLVVSVAATDAHILINGENGTGKELVADLLHQQSHRASGPFVKINCAAIPSELIEAELFGYRRGAFTGATSDRLGLFEVAKGGTLLLDEIGDMPAHLQAKLLRVLQERRGRPIGSQRDVELDFRLVSSTNCDLQSAIKCGRFREDLYFRVNTINVTVPPLRERPEDVALLAEHFRVIFADKYAKKVGGISPASMHLLTTHTWRGNVRELEHAIERAVIMAQGDGIETEDLRDTLRATVLADAAPSPGAPRLQTLAALEKWAIQRTLEHTRGNKQAAAAILGVYRPTLYNKLRKYGIGEIGETAPRD